jgi:hypothetical protein
VSIGVDGLGAGAAPEDEEVMVMSEEGSWSRGIEVEVGGGGSEVDMVKKLPAAREAGSICFHRIGSPSFPFVVGGVLYSRWGTRRSVNELKKGVDAWKGKCKERSKEWSRVGGG